MSLSRPLISFGAGVALFAASAAVAAPAESSAGAALSLPGLGQTVVDVCGHRVSAGVATRNTRVAARVSVASSRRARGRLTLVRESCAHGRWRRVAQGTLGRFGLRARTVRHAVSTARPGVYRLRVLQAGRALGRAVYLRVLSTPPGGGPSAPGVLSVPVAFRVRNVNGSRVACPSDGRDYVIRGHLVGPRAVVESAGPAAATLYLHEFSWGEFFWNLPVAGYDYADAQARAGRVSIVVDRLGYDSSPGPDGTQICMGSQADMAHQIVGQLRSGRYSATGVAPRPFVRVGLGGHAVGGEIAELEAYSFRDVDALVLLATADQGFSSAATAAAARQGAACLSGGKTERAGGPRGYEYIDADDQEFVSFEFYDADPAVVAASVARDNPDPCGDASSQPAVLATNQSAVREIAVPVLLLYGLRDAVNDQPAAGEQQRDLYTGSRDVTTVFVPGAGHAVTLERSAARTRSAVAAWLAARGL